MFDLIYMKLKRFHDKLSYHYAHLIQRYACIFIFLYFILNVTLFALLFVLRLNLSLNTQSLMFTKNSDYFEAKNDMARLFEQDQTKRHYAQQLLDGGYYAEFILRAKSAGNDTNLINKQVLEEYDFLFREITSLSIVHKNRTYKYSSDLCAKRLNKCSIEGGLLHAPSFQKDLLNRQVMYEENDGRTLHMDVVAVDGVSMEFLFGKRDERDERLNTERARTPNGYYSVIYGAKNIRNRFDLMYNTVEHAELSLLWLDRFVSYMKENSTKLYKLVDISFTTSHHLEREIEHYSQFDVKYIAISFILIIAFFFLYIWFDFQTNRKYMLRFCAYMSSKMHRHRSSTCRLGEEARTSSKLSKYDFYLPFLCLSQLVFSITSTISLLNLMKIELTPLLMTNVFILILISFNQTLNLYKAVSTVKHKKDNIEEVCKINIPKRLTYTFQNLLIPQLYSCVSIAIVYTAISFVTAFEAIRTYSICTSVMVLISFINQILFLCPYLALFLKRINSSRNCLLCCFKCKNVPHDDTNNRTETPPLSTHYYHIVKQASTVSTATQRTEIDLENETTAVAVEILMNDTASAASTPVTTKPDKNQRRRTRIKRTPSHDNISFQTSTHLIKFFLFNKKLNCLMLVFFVTFFIFNLIMCLRIKTELPVLELIPTESYLHKHMVWHQEHFSLGPMVIIVFKQPLDYWNNDTRFQIQSYLNDLKNLQDMNHAFELNWLQTTNESTSPSCMDTKSEKQCFIEAAVDYVVGMEAYHDDVNIYADNVPVKNSSNFHYREKVDYKVTSSRFYLQFKHFYGSQTELETWKNIMYLTYEKHKYSKADVRVFTFLIQVLEQMNEIKYEFLYIILITLDLVIILKFFYICQLRFIYIHFAILLSLLVSILSFLHLFQLTFNIVVLLHFMIAPALVIEYLCGIDYIYLHRKFSSVSISNGVTFTLTPSASSSSTTSSCSSSISSELSSMLDKMDGSISQKQLQQRNADLHKFQLIKSLFKINLNTNTMFILILLAAFLLMSNCSTYNFAVLFKILLCILINLFLHINIFYPTLLIFFDNQNKLINQAILNSTVVTTVAVATANVNTTNETTTPTATDRTVVK